MHVQTMFFSFFSFAQEMTNGIGCGVIDIAFHLQLVLLSYRPIFLRPCHFLKLGANRTKSASVEGRYINT